MHHGDRIENLFSVYILDLCFIMPAFAYLAIQMLRNQPTGYVLTPIIFILGFFLIFSLAVSELVKPLFDKSVLVGPLVMSLSLSLLFLVAACLHLSKLELNREGKS